MCFLDLIEEYDGVWFASHGLCELSALVVAHVSRRCTDESADAVLLLILGHVDSSHHRLVVEEVFGECLCEFCLSDAGGAEEDERADRSFGVLQSGTAAAYGIADGAYGFVLPDDAAVEFFFEVEEFLALGLLHLGYGDSCPSADDFCDIVGSHLFLDHCLAFLS